MPPLLATLDMDVAAFADKGEYERLLKRLQLEMLTVQQSYFRQKRRAVIVFEGPDAAGKGGAIKRMTERLDPRGVHVWPIGAPKEWEAGKHWLYRFWQRLPEPGTFAVFDRSWYGRVLVERVEKFAAKEEWERAYGEINAFESMLVADGVRLVKLLVWITKEEQRDRFRERLENPYKRWKLTPEDLRNRAGWKKYEQAFDDMLERTSTEAAPWHVIPGNRKWFARVEVLRTVIDVLRRGVDVELPPLDPEVKKLAGKVLGL
ncbi:MAG: polyphosphate kinase [Rhodospirillales bacterium]|nr:polyphosphate kinase [Rhodospirillales bacterium]